jgi:hypothetical protein
MFENVRCGSATEVVGHGVRMCCTSVFWNVLVCSRCVRDVLVCSENVHDDREPGARMAPTEGCGRRRAEEAR